MSHSGTYLVLRNRGKRPCQLTPVPQVAFAGTTGPLPIVQRVKGVRFMHPGPVALPINLQPGGELTASLYWVSSEVFDRSICVDPTSVSLQLNASALTAPLLGHLCGEQGQGITVQVSRFQPSTPVRFLSSKQGSQPPHSAPSAR